MNNVTFNAEVYLNLFQWKAKFDQVPADIKAQILKRTALTLYNYHEAKTDFKYLLEFRTEGLYPNNENITNPGLRLWWWVTTSTILSLGMLIDSDKKTNSIIALQRKIDHFCKSYTVLSVPNIRKVSAQSNHSKEITKLRGNVFAHSNIDFLENIGSGSFALEYDMVHEFLDECFSCLKDICDYYFEGEIKREVEQDYMLNFARKIVKVSLKL